MPAGRLISSYGAFVVLGSQHFTFCCVLVLFYFIINSFIFIIRHYSRLSVSIRFYLSLLATTDSSLFATIRHYSSLFVTIRHYSPLFATIRHYSSLFVTIRHYSPLFATIRRYSRLFGRYSGFISSRS